MKLTVNAVNFEMAERLEKYIDKKTKRYEKVLNNAGAELQIRMSVIKPETNLNKETKVRVIGNGPEMFAEKVCDTFEQGLDQCLDIIDRQIEKLKDRESAQYQDKKRRLPLFFVVFLTALSVHFVRERGIKFLQFEPVI